MPAYLSVAGKRVRALAVHLGDHSPTGAQLIYVKDTTSNVRYLVDFCATLSIIPHRSLLPPSGPAILNANGGLIPSWEIVTKHLYFGHIIFLTIFCKPVFLSHFVVLIF
jgi:hypothetical protein